MHFVQHPDTRGRRRQSRHPPTRGRRGGCRTCCRARAPFRRGGQRSGRRPPASALRLVPPIGRDPPPSPRTCRSRRPGSRPRSRWQSRQRPSSPSARDGLMHARPTCRRTGARAARRLALPPSEQEPGTSARSPRELPSSEFGGFCRPTASAAFRGQDDQEAAPAARMRRAAQQSKRYLPDPSEVRLHAPIVNSANSPARRVRAVRRSRCGPCELPSSGTKPHAYCMRYT
jgi:hypothetical protein